LENPRCLGRRKSSWFYVVLSTEKEVRENAPRLRRKKKTLTPKPVEEKAKERRGI